jgi:hypothetical protein
MQVSVTQLEDAVTSIQERAKSAGHFSELFVDTNILGMINKRKNQIVYGRRGTGKTHLLNRLKEYYQETFDTNKILPIYIDARAIAEKFTTDEANPGISIVIVYRRLLDEILTAFEHLLKDPSAMSKFERFWSGSKREKLRLANEMLHSIRKEIRFGEVETRIPGTVDIEHTDKRIASRTTQIGIDLKLVAELKKLADANAGFAAGLSKVSSKNAEESMKIIFQGLTVLNFNKVNQDLDIIIQQLEPEAVVILLDEWSAIELDHQPLLAEMIRSTIVSGRRIFVKFACIPFLTRLSANKPTGQSVGFRIGEEIFVDIDLDRLYSAYVDPENISAFLLRVLQKHLGRTIHPLMNAEFNDAFRYFAGTLFENEKTIAELVLASAGVPRDFLRIFTRAYHQNRTNRNNIPITLKNIRLATHELFQDEKRPLVQTPESMELFEMIFNKVCLPSKTYLFFVSQGLSKARVLQELWHHRLLHLLFLGVSAFAEENYGTYDVYAIDYGRYIQMASSKKGEALMEGMKASTNLMISEILPVSGIIPFARSVVDPTIKSIFSKFFVSTIRVDSPDLKDILDDCSKLVIDRLVKTKIQTS